MAINEPNPNRRIPNSKKTDESSSDVNYNRRQFQCDIGRMNANIEELSNFTITAMRRILDSIDQLNQAVVNISAQLNRHTDYMSRYFGPFTPHFNPPSPSIYPNHDTSPSTDDLINKIMSHGFPHSTSNNNPYPPFPAPQADGFKTEEYPFPLNWFESDLDVNKVAGRILSFINEVVSFIQTTTESKIDSRIYLTSTRNTEALIREYHLEYEKLGDHVDLHKCIIIDGFNNIANREGFIQLAVGLIQNHMVKYQATSNANNVRVIGQPVKSINANGQSIWIFQFKVERIRRN